MRRKNNTEIITLNGREIEVAFNYYGGCNGARDVYGVPLEPDDPPEIELLSIVDCEDKNRTDILDDLTSTEIETIETQLLDAAKYNKEDYDSN